MPVRSAGDALQRTTRRRALQRSRMPSTTGYVLVSLAITAAVFSSLWWILRTGGDEAPWLASGLAAGVVILIAFGAREVVMRRAWTRYALEVEMRADESPQRLKSRFAGSGVGAASGSGSTSSGGSSRRRSTASVPASAAALRALEQRLMEAEAAGEQQPEAHLQAYRLCEQYLANTEEAMRANNAAPEVRVALRAGQERVRERQKHHLLSWVRGEAKRVTHEAQRRVRMSDKIETAQRAIDVIGEALKIYPDERELRESAAAVRDFMASVKIAHWVELAERAAFRGLLSRAIARYRDALFYVSRADMSEGARTEAANRIGREIDMLRARLATAEKPVKKVDTARSVKRETAAGAPRASKPFKAPPRARESSREESGINDEADAATSSTVFDDQD